MKKFMQKILVFLCATLCLFGCVACGTTGGGLGGKTAEQKGRARFAEIPVGVYVDGQTHANGWELNQEKRLYDGGNIELSADGTLTIWHNDNPNVRIDLRLGKFIEFSYDVWTFEVEGSNSWDEIWVYKNTKQLDIKVR